MIERLRKLLNEGQYIEARKLANYLYEQGEQSEIFWILNATLYHEEKNRQAEYASIVRGIAQNAYSYELYYMLGQYYRETNINQAYLCVEQAEYYCNNLDDKKVIQSVKNEIKQDENCKVRPLSIVILSYNIKNVMIGCIESIRKTCFSESYELIVVDNASTDGITEWLKQQNDIVLQCNRENMGFAKGCNQGIALAAKENDILLLNNDTLVPSNAIFWLRMGLYERESVGATGPLTNYAGNDQQIVGKYETKEEFLKLAGKICLPNPNAYENKVWLVGFAMMIKRIAMKKVGKLDTRYAWGNYEDTDYGMMLSMAGYELLLCYNSFVFHYGSMNMAKDKQKYLSYINKNGKRLIEKWKFNPIHCNEVDTHILEEMDKDPKEKIRILQIGCGWGATLARIKFLHPFAYVCGIEESEKKAELGKKLADITIGKAWDMVFPYLENYFDYIVVEKKIILQIPDIDEFKSKIKKYLKKNGKLIGFGNEESCIVSEEKYQEVVLDYREKSQYYLEQIDLCIKEQTSASIARFVQIMQEKEMLENCVDSMEELSYAQIFSVITIKEMQKKGEVIYLLNGNSIQKLIKVLKQIEFRIWEVEFEGERESEQHLYDVMKQYYITPEAMFYIIMVSAMDKYNMFITMSCIYLDHQNIEEAILLLTYSLEQFPHKRELLQILVDLCEKTGRKKQADYFAEQLEGIG